MLATFLGVDTCTHTAVFDYEPGWGQAMSAVSERLQAQIQSQLQSQHPGHALPRLAPRHTMSFHTADITEPLYYGATTLSSPSSSSPPPPQPPAATTAADGACSAAGGEGGGGGVAFRNGGMNRDLVEQLPSLDMFVFSYVLHENAR